MEVPQMIILIVSVISLFILYYTIKWAIIAAYEEIEELKNKRLFAEKERLNQLLQNKTISEEDYYKRVNLLPVSVIHA